MIGPVAGGVGREPVRRSQGGVCSVVLGATG